MEVSPDSHLMMCNLVSYVCSEPSCKTSTRQLLYEGRCVNVGCKGRVVAERFSERATNDSLRYLQGLFDVNRYKIEQGCSKIDEVPFEAEFTSIRRLVDEVISQSKYNKVDLGALFSFMQK